MNLKKFLEIKFFQKWQLSPENSSGVVLIFWVLFKLERFIEKKKKGKKQKKMGEKNSKSQNF